MDAGLPPATMAVNVSAIEFQQESFLENLFAILAETGLDPRSLQLELTESVLMSRVHGIRPPGREGKRGAGGGR
jgi:EAL domain-containing protein (putative c-di-GMP-specific phosphodiesterase class I)